MRSAPLLAALAALLAAGLPAPQAQGASARDLHADGLKFLEAGKIEKAEQAFTKALKADPAFARAYFDRGRVRARAGNADGARSDLDRWLEHDPKYALVRADFDLLLFADERKQRRNADEAAARRDEAAGNLLSAFRHYAVAYALSLEEEGEADLAEALIRAWKACKVKPGFPPGLKRYLAQGQFHAGNRRHEEAAVAYRQAARFCPWCAEAHYNAGMILGEYRRYKPAVESLKRARSLLPEGPESQEVDGFLITWEMLGE